MKKLPEVLLDQHRAKDAQLERVSERVLAEEVSASGGESPRRAKSPDAARGMWSFFPLSLPGMAAACVIAVAAFAAGWGVAGRGVDAAKAGSLAASERPAGTSRTSAVPTTGGMTLDQVLASTRGARQQVQLAKHIALLDASQTTALLVEAQNSPSKHEYYMLREMLMAHLTELNPQSALIWAQNQIRADDRYMALRTVFDSWPSRDFQPLIDTLNNIPNVNQRRDLQGELVGAIASQDPQAALDYLNKLPPGQRQPYIYSQVFDLWARTDPAAAVAAAQSLPPGMARNIAIENIGQAWAQKDASAALAWAQTLPSGQTRNNMMFSIMNQFANADPESALKLLDDLPNNNLRMNMIHTVANAWAQKDPAAALNWAQNADIAPQILQSVIPNILRQLGEIDPKAAASYVALLPTGPMRQNAVLNVASQMAETDPMGALGWAESMGALANNNQRRNVFSMIINSWANNDPMAAAEYLQQHLDVPGANQAAQNVASQIAQFDPATAFAWAQNLPESQSKANAIRNVLYQQVNVDPESVWNYLQTLPAEDTRFRDMTQVVVSNWAQQNPAQAAQAVATLPDGQQTNQAYSNLAGTWLEQDPHEASKWIASLPGGTARDNAVGRLVATQAQYEPDTSFAWAMTIENDAMRTRNLRTAARELYRRDPTLAEQVITASGLPQEQAVAMLQQAQTDATRPGRGNPGIMIDPAVSMPRPMMRTMEGDMAALDIAPEMAARDMAVASSAMTMEMSAPADAQAKIAGTAMMAADSVAPSGGNGMVRVGKPLLVAPPASVKPKTTAGAASPGTITEREMAAPPAESAPPTRPAPRETAPAPSPDAASSPMIMIAPAP